MHRSTTSLGFCASLFLFAIIHTTNGIALHANPHVVLAPMRRQAYIGVSDASIEGECLAKNGYFKCHSGTECVSIYDLCDAVRDCDDGSDEHNCPEDPSCGERSHGRCKNGLCVYKFADCTGRDSCGDGSRNENCLMCRANSFMCSNKRCIHADERCTGLDACGDGSSNLNCTTCNRGAHHFPKSGRCIPFEDICSGFEVSGDRESDSKCTECKPGANLCDNKVCVRIDLWCNGEDVCGDNSSNKNCSWCRNMAKLTEDNQCIPQVNDHHRASPLPAPHHFTYGFVIGILALIAIVAVSVIALYILYPSKFRWLHRRGDAGLVM